MSNPIITRFAPSPTGYIHVGNARTALINWLFARHFGGTFVLRIDDTDRERSKEKYTKAIRADLKWLGIDWDYTFHQFSRQDLYNDAIENLKSSGRLYACYETPEELNFKRKSQLKKGLPPKYDREGLFLSQDQKRKYEAEGRKPHWRFKLEDREIKWDDLVHGPLSFQAKNLSDPILVKPGGNVVFTLATVVDDIDKKITHVLRGDDHISNTALQVQIKEALDKNNKEIHYGHLPLITNKEGEGLSKRLGSQSLQEFIEQGIEPIAMTSLLATIGTSVPIQLFYSVKKLIEEFDIKSFSKSSAKFNDEDLKKLSKEAFQQLSIDEINKRLEKIGCKSLLGDTWPSIAANSNTLEDVVGWQKILFGKISQTPSWSWPDTPKNFYQKALELLPSEPFTEKSWKIWMEAMKKVTGLKGKKLIMPLRLALTDKQDGPEMKEIVRILGKRDIQQRLERLLRD